MKILKAQIETNLTDGKKIWVEYDFTGTETNADVFVSTFPSKAHRVTRLTIRDMESLLKNGDNIKNAIEQKT